jgi:Cdc6-like AAA superfamily ATPase
MGFSVLKDTPVGENLCDLKMNIPDTQPQTEEDWQARIFDAMEAFSPGAPIDAVSLLAGRKAQLGRMIDTVMQRGAHAILYGERGVGKSSLANTFAMRIATGARVLSCIPVNCLPTDGFSDVWRKVFRRLEVNGQNVASKYPNSIDPDEVVIELSGFGLNVIPIIILDEFDKIPTREVRNLVANTIKNLSDRSIRATVIVVGVADSVSDLIDEHESIARCLRQIPMQRMSADELKQIIEDRLPDLGMIIKPNALAHIAALSRGLPHFAHLLGQQSAKKALERRQLAINIEHVEMALPSCIEETARTIREQYHQATMSPRKANIYKEVLLAAALAQVDDLGYFAPVDLRKPLAEFLKKPDVLVSLFAQHLKILCESDRGSILEATGSERKYRYRFVEPMMQPFILINGLRSGLITRQQVNDLAATHYEPRFSNDF